MLDDEYQIPFFEEHGFLQKTCCRCGNVFWTRDPDRTTCGDAPCDHYGFIGKPVFNKKFDVAGMRKYYLDFFAERGHTPIDRYPVVARWRDDIYLTIASIADFQPFVTSGLVPPPANPLTISQPCIRLNDLDSVGRTGRHLTTFEMMAHHVFNNTKKEYYWKDHAIELCDELLTGLGTSPADITYIKNPWAGGGNAGASVEVMVSGLELATLVFMNLKETKTGTIDVKGKMYEKMDNYIIDTGYGLERFVWASQGTPTIYDAIFPEIIKELTDIAGIDHRIHDPEYAEIFAQNAKFAGLMDVSDGGQLMALRQKVADEIGRDVNELNAIMEPMEKIYAIADHTRCLTFMLGDGIIPSNVKGGYLARLVLRKTIRLLKDLNMDVSLADLVRLHIDNMPEYPEFAENFNVIEDILAGEEEKYAQTLERGKRIIQRSAEKYKGKGAIPVEELMEIYESHGIQPEITQEVAGSLGVDVDFPDNFYSLLGEKRNEAEEKEIAEFKYADKIARLPATKKLYYDEPERTDFEAVVLDVFDNIVVLDSTFFYPEGGGQENDTGLMTSGNFTYDVTDVQIKDGVIMHRLDPGDNDEIMIRKGDIVAGKVNKQRRMALSRHHTATHIINDAARKVLGNHIWQAGAQKTEERARLDLSHYKHISREELDEIEMIANRTVMENKKVGFEWVERTEAEQKYGFGLYQGGVPHGATIRVVKVGSDIEACGGTHCLFTGDVGPIKILRTERIQDGVERLEYAAGEAAVKAVRNMEALIRASSETLSVPAENLPSSVDRFFREWKDLQKENERLKSELAVSRVRLLLEDAQQIGNVRFISAVMKGADVDELRKIALEMSSSDDVVCILLSDTDGAKAVASCGRSVIAGGLKAGDLVREMSKILGGGGGGKPDIAIGGGTQPENIEKAIEAATDMVRKAFS